MEKQGENDREGEVRDGKKQKQERGGGGIEALLLLFFSLGITSEGENNLLPGRFS